MAVNPKGGGRDPREQLRAKDGRMNALDLTKATLVCGSVAYLVYSFPVISQSFIIGLLTVMWLSYAYRLMKNLLGR